MALAPALVELGILALVLWVLATALAIAVIMGYIAGVLRGLPFPLNQLAGPVDSLAQGITNVAGKLEAGVDHLIGASWHVLARYLDGAWHGMVWFTHALARTAEMCAQLWYAHSHLKQLVHWLTARHDASTARIKHLEREYRGIEHQVKTLEKEYHGIDEIGIRKKLGTLDREVTRINTKTIPKLRERVAADEGTFAGLESWLGISAKTDYKAWAIGLATALLGAVGLGGLRCNSLLNSMNKRGCGFWKGIEDLLGLFVDTLLLTNVCTLVPVLESAVSAVADPLVIALTDVGAGLCSGGIGPAPALQVPALSLPASPGVTLNLP